MISSIRCSGLARPMNCAGSLFLDKQYEEPDHEAAKAGTAAGEYLEYLLNDTLTIPDHAKNGVLFDDDMIYYATQAAEEIKSRAGTVILCEKPIDWQTQSGITIKGHPDMSYELDSNTLGVDDYKYGWNIVEPFENWQLLGYAIGEVIQRGIAYTSIRLRIIQPRAHHDEGHIREWTISYAQLLEYKEKIEARMHAIKQGENSLATGKHCRYCEKATGCPAFNKAFYRGVEEVHKFVQDSIDNDELSFQLDLITRIKEVMKLKDDSLKALAVHRMKAGQLVPNYVSKDRWGDRKWNKGIDANFIQAMTGKDVTKTTMLSPAQAEKKGVDKEMVKSLTARPHLGQSLKKCDTAKLGDKIFGKGEGTDGIRNT